MVSADDSTDSSTGEAAAGVDAPRLEYFWRPGCPFCMLLERDLQRSGIGVVSRNIWEDPEAAAIVRSVADGNETVPTVKIGERALVNPSIDAVAELLRQVAGG